MPDPWCLDGIARHLRRWQVSFKFQVSQYLDSAVRCAGPFGALGMLQWSLDFYQANVR